MPGSGVNSTFSIDLWKIGGDDNLGILLSVLPSSCSFVQTAVSVLRIEWLNS